MKRSINSVVHVRDWSSCLQRDKNNLVRQIQNNKHKEALEAAKKLIELATRIHEWVGDAEGEE